MLPPQPVRVHRWLDLLALDVPDPFALGGLQYSVMVTAGANQGLASLMLTLLDPPDKTVLFKPYYFNALMALQMTGLSLPASVDNSEPAQTCFMLLK